jgi:hypothetical protein
MKGTLDNYVENFGQQNAMVYNSVHKLGKLYDTLFFLRRQLAIDRSEILTASEMGDHWHKIGEYAGLILSIVLYTPAGGTQPKDPLSAEAAAANGGEEAPILI